MINIDIEKIEQFLKKNETVIWKPIQFPEDMTEENTLSELESEGNDMFFALDQAKAIISTLLLGIKHMKTNIEDAKGIGDADMMEWFLDNALEIFKNKG